MPAPLQPGLDLGQLGSHPLGDRDALDPEPSCPVRRADVREAQEVERLRFARTPPASLPGGMPPELEQPGLVRVQLQPEPREPSTKLRQELPRVLLVLEPDHEIVGPPDDDHLTVGMVVTPPRHP